jgi:hypothetical protein
LTDGNIEQLPGPADPDPARSEQEARNAQQWYRSIIADSFGA